MFTNKMNSRFILIGFTSLYLFSCSKTEIQISPFYPVHFPEIAYKNASNEPNSAKINLGRYLFYDKNLSLTKTVSCGSCHAQVHGFSDHNLPVSFGIYNRTGLRNSPSIVNMAWNTSFMWDGGIRHLDVMPIAPFTDTTEMGMSLPEVISRIKNNSQYSSLYQKAYGSTTINETTTLLALSQFMNSLISSNSKYDQVILGKASFTNNEQAGYTIFKNQCNSCHKEPLFTDFSFAQNGMTNSGNDYGRFRITQVESDKYKFKVPTLRNVTQTYPYLHNGSVSNLKQVLELYAHLPSQLKDARLSEVNLSPSEIEYLLEFLKTLEDWDFMSNPTFSDPY